MTKQNKVGINTKVLTADELAEYRHRSQILDPAVAERWSRQGKNFRTAIGVCYGLGMLTIILLSGGDNPFTMVLSLLAGTAVPLGIALMSVGEFQHSRRPKVLARQASDYLAEINYDERLSKWLVKRGVPGDNSDDSDTGGPDYWATGVYDPDRFYRIVQSHAQYELDAMRDYGMTADEWDANRPD